MTLHPDIAAVLEGKARWALEHADCREVLPTLGDKAVAHVIADPPYEAEAHTKGRRLLQGTSPGRRVEKPKKRETVAAPLPFAAITSEERQASAAEMARVTRRWCLVFCQLEGAFPWRDAMEASGFARRRICIWVKPDGQPQLSGDRPGHGYETICATHRPGRSRWNGGGRCGVFTHIRNTSGSTERDPHPTTKPINLMLELVSLFTDAGEVVLDPFAGSGTTGVACLRLGRRFIGIEKDAKYAAVARERLEAETQGLTLRDARAGQQPLFPVQP